MSEFDYRLVNPRLVGGAVMYDLKVAWWRRCLLIAEAWWRVRPSVTFRR